MPFSSPEAVLLFVSAKIPTLSNFLSMRRVTRSHLVLTKRDVEPGNENGLMVSALDSESSSPVSGPDGDIGYELLTQV